MCADLRINDQQEVGVCVCVCEDVGFGLSGYVFSVKSTGRYTKE